MTTSELRGVMFPLSLLSLTLQIPTITDSSSLPSLSVRPSFFFSSQYFLSIDHSCVGAAAHSEETVDVCQLLHQVILLRDKYVYKPLLETNTNAFTLNKMKPSSECETQEQPYDPFNMQYIPPSQEIFEKEGGVFNVYRTTEGTSYIQQYNNIIDIDTDIDIDITQIKRQRNLSQKYPL